MCKLSAVVPITRNRNDLKAIPMILTGMMFENARLSNKDGFGMGIPATGSTYKKMVSATVGLIEAEPLQWLWSNCQLGQIMVGHVRLSTTARGNNEDRNAHPFVVGPWTLCHNGHISNYEELHEELGLPKEVAVDSEVALLALADTWGGAKTLTIDLIRKGLDRLEGSYAFTIGNKNEPDRLYLIVGSNSLSVYSNERFRLVNTDSQMLSFLDQLMWNVGIGYGHWQQLSHEALIANHVYTLDKDGTVDLGTFVPKVATRSVSTTVYYGTSSTPKTTTSSQPHGQNTQPNSDSSAEEADHADNQFGLINPCAAAKQVVRLEDLLEKFQLTLDDLEEMLVELPTVVPHLVWALDDYNLNMLADWFTYLSTLPNDRFTPNRITARRVSWGQFKARCREVYHDDYQNDYYGTAQALKPDFVRPYYFNTCVAIDQCTAQLGSLP